jgi:hypothetical protein
MNDRITTEGRIFVKNMILDVRKREKLGAGLLSPGAANWRDAIEGFGKEMSKCGQPQSVLCRPCPDGSRPARARRLLRELLHEPQAQRLPQQQ